MDGSEGIKAMYDKAAPETATASNQPTTVTDKVGFWNLPARELVIVPGSRQNRGEVLRYDAKVAEIHRVLITHILADMDWSALKVESKEGWGGPATLTDREGMVDFGFFMRPQVIPLRSWQNGGEGYDIADAPPGMERSSLKEAIRSLLGKASKEGWDGDGAAALEDDTVKVALDLVDTFPNYTKNPDVDVTPYGEIDFDWMIDNDTMLTVSVLSSRAIGFSGLFHDAKISGSEPWNGTLPQFVSCCFERFKLLENS